MEYRDRRGPFAGNGDEGIRQYSPRDYQRNILPDLRKLRKLGENGKKAVPFIGMLCVLFISFMKGGTFARLNTLAGLRKTWETEWTRHYSLQKNIVDNDSH